MLTDTKLKALRPRAGLYRLARILRRLDALHVARESVDLNVPGFDFHPRKGPQPARYSLHVNGPWCITIEWAEGDALRVNLEQYH